MKKQRLHHLVVGGVVVAATVVGLAARPALGEAGNDKSEVKTDKLDKSEKMKQRLEQLFIWRVSDRLQLTPSEEAKFTEQFRKLSEERTKLSQQLEATLDQIDREKENTEKTTKLLTDYAATMKRYNQAQNKELDVMSKLLGPKKMVQYVLLKREMTQKFKDVLSSQNQASARAAEKANLKEPEVIEQK